MVRLELIAKQYGPCICILSLVHYQPLPQFSSRWHCSHAFLFGSGELEAWLVLSLIGSGFLLCRGPASVNIHFTK